MAAISAREMYPGSWRGDAEAAAAAAGPTAATAAGGAGGGEPNSDRDEPGVRPIADEREDNSWRLSKLDSPRFRVVAPAPLPVLDVELGRGAEEEEEEEDEEVAAGRTGVAGRIVFAMADWASGLARPALLPPPLRCSSMAWAAENADDEIPGDGGPDDSLPESSSSVRDGMARATTLDLGSVVGAEAPPELMGLGDEAADVGGFFTSEATGDGAGGGAGLDAPAEGVVRIIPTSWRWRCSASSARDWRSRVEK